MRILLHAGFEVINLTLCLTLVFLVIPHFYAVESRMLISLFWCASYQLRLAAMQLILKALLNIVAGKRADHTLKLHRHDKFHNIAP